MTLSPIASSVTMARGRVGSRLGSAAGSISIAVSSSAGSPALSTSVLDNSTRVTSPCAPTSSIS